MNSKLNNSKFKTLNCRRQQLKTQNSKFKIAKGNNSKFKTQNSKLLIAYSLVKCLADVVEDIVDIFYAHRQTYKVGRHASLAQLLI